MKTIASATALLLWSGSALAINSLIIGGGGNMATIQAYDSGDIPGSYTNVSYSTYNSMSLSELMAYDAVVLLWDTDPAFNLDWAGKMGPYVEAGGGFWYDGDGNNTGDLSPIVSATPSGCGGPWTVYGSVPGLTDGVNGDFANCHVQYSSPASWLTPIARDSAGSTVMLAGEYGGGRVYLTGPDHDFHANRGGGGSAGNQYTFVLNIINWITDGCEAVAWYRDEDGDGYGDAGSTTMACEAPTGYVSDSTDCNDSVASINPGAAEFCDGVDNDCDSVVDPTSSVDATTWYEDFDGDGYGDSSLLYAYASCSMPEGYTSLADATDCNDGDSTINPSAVEVCDYIDNDCDAVVDPDDSADASTWYADADGDGYGDMGSTDVACYEPAGFVADATDCDDSASGVNPAATEVCDGIDNDCDAVVDPDDSADASTWYADADGDGYGDMGSTDVACYEPAGFVADATDCDDSAAGVNPGATEVCDGIDNDCDAVVDPDDSADASTWYADRDGDGYGDVGSMDVTCYEPAGFVADATDCDDSAAGVNPGATEVCDGIDNNCDDIVDPDDSVDAATWYADVDADGYGDAAVSAVTCSAGEGWVADSSDCDDSAAGVNPGATEVCDGIDNDCDTVVDPGDAADATTWYEDYDGDGYGDPSLFWSVSACEMPEGYTGEDLALDCNDVDADVSPAATEVCDGIDNDCDDVVDPDDSADALTFYADADGDGYGAEAVTTMACAATDGWVADWSDCDDADAEVNPAATEVCDGIDNDCDGELDPESAEGAETYYADTDGDGFGDAAVSAVTCVAEAGWVMDATDCDDSDASVNPDAAEVCDGLDNDCSGEVDGADAEDAVTYYVDADGDGYGLETIEEICEEVESDCDTGADEDTGGCFEEVCTEVSDAVMACELPEGFVEDNTDCDDEDAEVYPEAPGLDEDCVVIEDDTGDVLDTGEVVDTGDVLDTGDNEGDDSDADGGAVDGEDGKDDAAGCACSTGSMAASTPWLAVLALVGLIRRRED